MGVRLEDESDRKGKQWEAGGQSRFGVVSGKANRVFALQLIPFHQKRTIGTELRCQNIKRFGRA
ncbi:hypothetical protein SD81_000770 [Tolypothrix campylonemoides VB511288]|nr:hypothetical protein SD81_000770 [Tolypothrix campylonemoides VB511288]